VFGNLAIDETAPTDRSELQRRGVPAYVAEWVLDSVVPGQAAVARRMHRKCSSGLADSTPAQAMPNLIKNRLLDGDIVKVLDIRAGQISS
jgi:ATP-dependent Lon protease